MGLTLFLRRVINTAADALSIVVLTKILSSDQFRALPPRLQERVLELTERSTSNFTGIRDNLLGETGSKTPNQDLPSNDLSNSAVEPEKETEEEYN